MSLVAVLGASYPMSSYARSRSGYLQPSAVYLGEDWFSTVVSGIKSAWEGGGKDAAVNFISGQRKAQDDAATTALWDKLLDKVLGSNSPAELEKAWYSTPTPWVIIGGVALLSIVLLTTLGKKRR